VNTMDRDNITTMLTIVELIEEWQLGSLLSMLAVNEEIKNLDDVAKFNMLSRICLFHDNINRGLVERLIVGLSNAEEWLDLSSCAIRAIVEMHENTGKMDRGICIKFLHGLSKNRGHVVEYLQSHCGEYD